MFDHKVNPLFFSVLALIEKLMTFCFFRSDVCDRNTESSRPEGEPDGLLRHHSTNWLLQWHSEYLTVGSWTFQGKSAHPTNTKLLQNLKLVFLLTMEYKNMNIVVSS